jgi:hypothetical protein
MGRAVPKVMDCHPELVEGWHNGKLLMLRQAQHDSLDFLDSVSKTIEYYDKF